MKVHVQNSGADSASLDVNQLQQRIEDLQNRTTPRSHQNGELINRLKEEGIEILSSLVDRKTTIVWIWCHSQAAIDNINKLYESNKLADVLFHLGNIRSASKIMQSIVINIDGNELKKSVGKFLLKFYSIRHFHTYHNLILDERNYSGAASKMSARG